VSLCWQCQILFLSDQKFWFCGVEFWAFSWKEKSPITQRLKYTVWPVIRMLFGARMQHTTFLLNLTEYIHTACIHFRLEIIHACTVSQKTKPLLFLRATTIYVKRVLAIVKASVCPSGPSIIACSPRKRCKLESQYFHRGAWAATRTLVFVTTFCAVAVWEMMPSGILALFAEKSHNVC